LAAQHLLLLPLSLLHSYSCCYVPLLQKLPRHTPLLLLLVLGRQVQVAAAAQ
jgi:hypothetical protein